VGNDTISDFRANQQDRIVLSKTTFSAISSQVGTLGAADFAVVATDAAVGTSSAAIVFSQSTRSLFYNENLATADFGNGGSFATLTGISTLSASDFTVAV
jgi:Ca2+-binding RTX toxin-like protein